jgi:hypothetical protein
MIASNDWIRDAPPPEWQEGMMIVVENDRGGITVQVIGTCTLVYPGYDKGNERVPGTESDMEGLGTDRYQWIGDTPTVARLFDSYIRAWHPGVSEHIHPIPALPWQA